jgi:hypothetical protein
MRYHPLLSTVQHILDIGHAHNTIEETLEVLHIQKKGRLLNTLEHFHMYNLSKQKLQMNETFTDTHNPTFNLNNKIFFIRSSVALQSFVGPDIFFRFTIFPYTDGRTPWTSDQPIARPLPTHRTIQTQNKCTHGHLRLEWDSNSLKLEKTVHPCDCVATMIGHNKIYPSW